MEREYLHRSKNIVNESEWGNESLTLFYLFTEYDRLQDFLHGLPNQITTVQYSPRYETHVSGGFANFGNNATILRVEQGCGNSGELNYFFKALLTFSPFTTCIQRSKWSHQMAISVCLLCHANRL